MGLTEENNTGRVEALSDGVFGVAITLLAIELKSPELRVVDNKNLFYALLADWPQYLTILNSFASVLVLWISHHGMFKLIRKASTAFMAANGLLLLFVTLTLFSTKTMSTYLLTGAAKTAAGFYALVSILLCGSFNLVWQIATKKDGLLKSNIEPMTLQVQTQSYRSGLYIYVLAFLAAFISAWLTVAITTASWVYWVISFKKTES
jgi:uncharacterized membrane protein